MGNDRHQVAQLGFSGLEFCSAILVRMRLTVLNVAYSFAAVGPNAIGGAEQVLSKLDAALVREGHESLVLACSGSSTAGKLFSTTRCSEPIDDQVRARAWRECRSMIQQISNARKIDLLHYHGIDFHQYLPPPGIPTLVTLHLPPSWYPPKIFEPRPRTWLHCVSRAQMRQCPRDAEMLPLIENGVSEYFGERSFRKRNYAIALGRICPEKGFHFAAEAARVAGIPLVLAGSLFPYPAHDAYFRQELAPRLNANFRFVGPVGLQRKRRWLAGACCLLVPSLAPETSSLVAMEALACGTPVVAFRVGALPEIIEDGKTGFLVENVSQMADAMHKAREIDPEVCRSSARMRFSLRRMTRQYLDLYRTLAGDTSPLPYFGNGTTVAGPYAMSES
jgi:glycosyltransferase involved in cell wall biosynthesis